ncbi:MAG: NAD(P)/FAD-dependent oxidoreductase [Bacteroidota bacterium]|nr:NAD(P)/FAD-dependent oxidoreductase [Bacteroidota bacterium]
MNTKQVVIVGGGFAGINLIKRLSKDKRFVITLVDKNNYHFFPPLLYQVSTAFIEPSNISYPFRRMFQNKKNLRFFMGGFVKVYPEQNKIETDNGTLTYDYLVLAMGAETNFFGMDEVKQNALPMKTIDEALNLRNHLLLSMEKAVKAETPEERNKYLNIVIAGGGPTGVELAGMIAELGKNIAVKEYPEIKAYSQHLYLVDAGTTLLAPMSKKAQEAATKKLTDLGVNLKFKVAVKGYDGNKVLLADGSTIETHSLIWASGVIAREVPGLPPELIGKGRRIAVNEYNQVQGIDNMFAIGDICMQLTDSNYPKGHPQLAQVAIQHGNLLGENIKAKESGQLMKAFVYNNKGSMAIISKYEAAADLPKFSFTGFFAWLIWLFIHIMPLVGFRSKVSLAFNWFWSFLSNDPTLRLIIRPEKDEDMKSIVSEEIGQIATAK